MPKTTPSTRKLISEPFGPYPEHQILNAQLPRKACLELKSVSMECAGSPVGLDDSEFIIGAREGSKLGSNHVHFYGKLEIQSLDWLSDQGRRWLEMDLRQRDREIHFEHALNGLTLIEVYGGKNSGMKITVWIQCEKSMQVKFLGEGHETSLIFYSKASHGRRDRMYDIKSLDVATFARSQNFLARYRLWALIDNIIAKDPNTPIEKRTIDWLVDNCLERFRKRDLHQRLIFDTAVDTHVEEKGTTKKRRHLPRAEIVGLFAAHAEWILAQHLASTSHAVRKLDMPSWISFCRKVKSARRVAKSNHARWGLAYGVEVESDEDDSDIDLSPFGSSREFWTKKLKATTIKKKAKPIEEPTHARYSPVIRPKQSNFGYDSDFSLASTSSAYDTDSDVSYSPELTSKVPPFCMRTPEIPTGRFKWECPGCEYIIDLLNLTEDNTRGLPSELGNFLHRKSWQYLNEEKVKWVMQNMISNHYISHLRKNGVQVVRRQNKCYIARYP